jgi:hypothetical protein
MPRAGSCIALLVAASMLFGSATAMRHAAVGAQDEAASFGEGTWTPSPDFEEMLLGIATPPAADPPPTAFPLPPVETEEAAVHFTEFLAARENTGHLAGPFADTIPQVEGSLERRAAGILTEDFVATVTFVNPAEATGMPWDYGFVFHETPETQQWVAVDSYGTWTHVSWPEGIQQSGRVPGRFDPALGATNTLEIIVNGTTALFGVNDEFVTSLKLPPPAAADVEVGTGYFVSDTVEGREVSFHDFEVWAVPGSADRALHTGTSPVAAPGTPEPMPPVSAADAEAFAAILAAGTEATPLAGPYSATLKELEDIMGFSWAGVELTDFYAQATFQVPEAGTADIWSIGFVFGDTPLGTPRIAADSEGDCLFSHSGIVPRHVCQDSGLETEVGEANTLDLIVAGGRALFGINGVLKAAVDLPAGSGTGDVAVGSGFFANHLLSGRVIGFRDFVILPVAPDALGAVAIPAAIPTSIDREQFLALVQAAETGEAVAGPFSGRLVEETPGTAPTAPAGVQLADFAAFATFTNPEDSSGLFWDAGFEFRKSEFTQNLIIIDSLGDVFTVLSGQAAVQVANADAYDATPGAANTVQLFVQGDRALFGVNGEFVAAFAVPNETAASDVVAGTAWFDQDFAEERATEYQDFRIWNLSEFAIQLTDPDGD